MTKEKQIPTGDFPNNPCPFIQQQWNNTQGIERELKRIADLLVPISKVAEKQIELTSIYEYMMKKMNAPEKP